jgi:protein-L-isoaspartate(D-aspartate) O-methyltransferase
MDKEELYNYLIDSKILVTPSLKKAFARIDRGDFVLPGYKNAAYQDNPLPIGFGQSISQPSTVAFMLELLDPHKDEVVLDVGVGSGWTTALLAETVGPKGRVYSVEIIPELLEYARYDLKKYRQKNITLKSSGQRLGLPEFSPFHKILVSAEAEDLPPQLLDQLATGGTLVLPISGSIIKIDKISDTYLETRAFPGFAFVPLQ